MFEMQDVPYIVHRLKNPAKLVDLLVQRPIVASTIVDDLKILNSIEYCCHVFFNALGSLLSRSIISHEAEAS